jgi:hypothetical protein
MAFNKTDFSRRAFLLSGAPAIVVGLEALALPSAPRAQNSDSSQGPTAPPKMWSAEYWAKRGDISLYLFRKRTGAPQSCQSYFWLMDLPFRLDPASI